MCNTAIVIKMDNVVKHDRVNGIDFYSSTELMVDEREKELFSRGKPSCHINNNIYE